MSPGHQLLGQAGLTALLVGGVMIVIVLLNHTDPHNVLARVTTGVPQGTPHIGQDHEDGDTDSDILLSRWSGGLDHCIDVPGLALPTDTASIPLLDQGIRLCPAMDIVGPLYQRPNAASIFESDVLVREKTVLDANTTPTPGTHTPLLSLRHQMQQLYSLQRAQCDPCVHGVRRFPSCVCSCQAGWSGDQCNSSTPSPPPSSSQYDTGEPSCLGPEMDTIECPSRRNWGADYVNEGNREFLCGGGYQYESPEQLWLGFMRCPAEMSPSTCHQTFIRERVLCCAPGVKCVRLGGAHTNIGSEQIDACADSIACCALENTMGRCHARGCSWCSDRFCVPPSVVASSEYTQKRCVAPFLIGTIAGDWDYHTAQCSSDLITTHQTNICDRATRKEYLSLYNPCVFSTGPQRWGSLACLTEARARVNAPGRWPRLAAGVGFSPDVLYHAAPSVLPGHCQATPPFSRAYLGRLSPNTVGESESGGALAVWTCGRGSSLWLVPTPALENGYQIYDITRTHCLARVATDTDAWQVAGQTLSPFRASSRIVRQQTRLPQGTVYWTDDGTCGSFGLEEDRWHQDASITPGLVVYHTNTSLDLSPLVVAPAHTPIPAIPPTCHGQCTQLPPRSTCPGRIPEASCLQKYYPNTPWPGCCACLWKHTTYREKCT